MSAERRSNWLEILLWVIVGLGLFAIVAACANGCACAGWAMHNDFELRSGSAAELAQAGVAHSLARVLPNARIISGWESDSGCGSYHVEGNVRRYVESAAAQGQGWGVHLEANEVARLENTFTRNGDTVRVNVALADPSADVTSFTATATYSLAEAQAALDEHLAWRKRHRQGAPDGSVRLPVAVHWDVTARILGESIDAEFTLPFRHGDAP